MRAPGYYWARTGSTWQIAEWDGYYWLRTGTPCGEKDEYFDEIGERVTPPAVGTWKLGGVVTFYFGNGRSHKLAFQDLGSALKLICTDEGFQDRLRWLEQRACPLTDAGKAGA